MTATLFWCYCLIQNIHNFPSCTTLVFLILTTASFSASVQSFATFFLPTGNVEASARCVALGSPLDSIWIHTPFPSASSLHRWGSSHCYEQHPQGFWSSAESDLNPPEGSDRKGSSSDFNHGFFSHYFLVQK